MRTFNTNVSGSQFDLATKVAVWQKAQIIPGYNAAVLRKDMCGAWIQWDQHGLTTNYGWEIDHNRPVALNGADEIANLWPLHWSNNRYKSDNFPQWYCKIV
jgi:hypothetical protein